MAITVLGGALQGIDAVPIEVEADLLQRLPSVCVVGLAASAVKESAERIRSAIESAGHKFPKKRVVINLAPADVRKEGTALDLPMALAILAAADIVPRDAVEQVVAAGELSLNGELRPVRGALSLGVMAHQLDRVLLLPADNAAQAALVPGVRVRGASTLQEVVEHLQGVRELPLAQPAKPHSTPCQVDLKEVRGQATARRALEIAAAGGHHLLFMGPPGCGKSMLARRLPTILPPLSFDEALESTRVHSAAGLLAEQPYMMMDRPFRAPHHTVTVAGLIGDRRLRPGEVSLAHHGVLFLDETPEFSRPALEVLRTPLEEGAVRVTRAEGTIEYPASVTLVLAANPCPCGRRGSASPCTCTDGDVHRYRRRLSGPILDRIDLYVELQPVPSDQLVEGAPGEPSASVRERVLAARNRQVERGQSRPNGRLTDAEMESTHTLKPACRNVLQAAVDNHGLSGRAVARLLKVARTIADLDGDAHIDMPHLSEALAYRPLEGQP